MVARAARSPMSAEAKTLATETFRPGAPTLTVVTPPAPASSRRESLFVPGHNCLQVASAERVSLIIDGSLAFCGGLDLTRSRWDTPAHTPGDPRRINEGEGDCYAPFHDTVMAMDGLAAGMLDQVVRDRWLRATSRPLKGRNKRRAAASDAWPESLPVSLTNTDVAVARTRAPMGDEEPVAEVLQLYLDTIAAAKDCIYLENQYFTSNALSDALAKRLAEPDGPEVIAVLRLCTQGWLEAPTMGTLRTVTLRKLRAADHHGRFHAFFPHLPGLPDGTCCDLHSKLASGERTLEPYERLDEVSDAMAAVAGGVADPEQPVSLETLITQFAPERTAKRVRPVWVLPAVLLATTAALMALWRFTPLAAWANASHILDWAAEFPHARWAPILVLLAYTPASLVLFPRPLITLFAVAAFGAWHGFAYAFTGILVACMATYALGLRLDRQTVRRYARGRLNHLSDAMHRRGILAITAVRLVPLAPFAVVNVVAGAIRIKPMHFLVGSAIGILPGTLFATVFGDQLVGAIHDPRSLNPWLIAALVVIAAALAAATWIMRRWLSATHPPKHVDRPSPSL
ncbi:MAG: VTT domain-containing protein [Gammaproteobacteria bacterium]